MLGLVSRVLCLWGFKPGSFRQSWASERETQSVLRLGRVKPGSCGQFTREGLSESCVLGLGHRAQAVVCFSAWRTEPKSHAAGAGSQAHWGRLRVSLSPASLGSAAEAQRCGSGGSKWGSSGPRRAWEAEPVPGLGAGGRPPPLLQGPAAEPQPRGFGLGRSRGGQGPLRGGPGSTRGSGSRDALRGRRGPR